MDILKTTPEIILDNPNVILWDNLCKKIQRWPLFTLDTIRQLVLQYKSFYREKHMDNPEYTRHFLSHTIDLRNMLSPFIGTFILIGTLENYHDYSDVYFYGKANIEEIMKRIGKSTISNDSSKWCMSNGIITLTTNTIKARFHLQLYERDDQVIGNRTIIANYLAYNGIVFLFTPLWAVGNLTRMIFIEVYKSNDKYYIHDSELRRRTINYGSIICGAIGDYNEVIGMVPKRSLQTKACCENVYRIYSICNNSTVHSQFYSGLFNTEGIVNTDIIDSFVNSYKEGITVELTKVLYIICDDADSILLRMCKANNGSVDTFDDVRIKVTDYFNKKIAEWPRRIVVTKPIITEGDPTVVFGKYYNGRFTMPFIINTINVSGLSEYLRSKLILAVGNMYCSMVKTKEKWWKL